MEKLREGGYAEGIKQRDYLTKDETSTPPVATEVLFLTCIIDAIEHCHVTTIAILGASTQAYMEGETVHMKMEGSMAEILTKLDPKLY